MRPERPFHKKIPGSLRMEPSESRSKSVKSVAVSVQLSVGPRCSGLQTFLTENPSRKFPKNPNRASSRNSGKCRANSRKKQASSRKPWAMRLSTLMLLLIPSNDRCGAQRRPNSRTRATTPFADRTVHAMRRRYHRRHQAAIE